jgi:hypothetical protein
MKKYVDGALVDLTAEEIVTREAEVISAKAEHTQRNTDEANAEIKKASGKQKLKDLGLDDDEIKALLGG